MTNEEERVVVRPRLLDLFCGAGGAAMGYWRAGFDVVGVDVAPQPRYPFEFVQADAMSFPLVGFDAVHASPPCQGCSRLRHMPWLKDRVYPLLIPAVRERLSSSGVPWVIENVQDAPLGGIWLCGSMFGSPVMRHRRFESSVFMLQPPHMKHREVLAHGGRSLSQRYRSSAGVTGVCVRSVAGHFSGIGAVREAMGIDWMNRDELAQAIPPAYTEFVGLRLFQAVRDAVA